MDTLRIIEVWKLHRVGGLSRKKNLVVLFRDGTHICTCMETITKGIICHHFWRVMLYSNAARFHISIIPIRWYKDEILMKLDDALENSPILTAIESSSEAATTLTSVDFTLQGLKYLQGSFYKENVQQVIPKRNRFGVAFSTAKTAINIALETGSDSELVKLLKDFILTKQRSRNGVHLEDNVDTENIELTGNDDNIVPLQQQLINQITDPNVTKIRGAPCKKRIKSSIEISGKKKKMHEITSQTNVQEVDDGSAVSKSQRKCHLCGKPGHYQKKCPSKRSREDD